MKAKMILSLIFILFCTALYAQRIHEPNSEIYKDIDRWEVQGYIRNFLPLIRPYPIALIDKILDEVILNGDENARQKASLYRENLAPGSRFIHFGLMAQMQGKNDEQGLMGAAYAEGLARFTELLSASCYLAEFGFTNEKEQPFNAPGTYSPYADIISDTANIGGLELRPYWTSLVAIGKSDSYFQAGLARTSVGPFYDNGIVVGPQTPIAGHFSYVFYREQWSYELLFQAIAASDDFGGGAFPGKYNVVHAISVRPLENLEAGFIQALVFGGRFEPMYLVPFSFIFAMQTLYDFEDNAFMGFHLRWRPIDTFLAKSQIYVDDLSFNGLFSGEMRFKLAFEAGISWAPKNSFLSKLDFDYTAVFPYCYTHWHQSDDDRYEPGSPNNLNYTHLGRNIGPDLEPNSDRISLRTAWNIIPPVDFNLRGYLIRHGNASDGLDKDPKEINDGSIFDDGSDSSGSKIIGNPRPNLFLLTQDVLDIRLGGGAGLTWTIPVSFGVFRIMGEYGIEYGWNRRIKGIGGGPEKGNNGLDQYWSIGGQWSW